MVSDFSEKGATISIGGNINHPGFPRGGGANFPGGALTYEFAKFSQKLHEIERIWTPGGGCVPGAPLRSPLPLIHHFIRL